MTADDTMVVGIRGLLVYISIALMELWAGQWIVVLLQSLQILYRTAKPRSIWN